MVELYKIALQTFANMLSDINIDLLKLVTLNF